MAFSPPSTSQPAQYPTVHRGLEVSGAYFGFLPGFLLQHTRKTGKIWMSVSVILVVMHLCVYIYIYILYTSLIIYDCTVYNYHIFCSFHSYEVFACSDIHQTIATFRFEDVSKSTTKLVEGHCTSHQFWHQKSRELVKDSNFRANLGWKYQPNVSPDTTNVETRLDIWL